MNPPEFQSTEGAGPTIEQGVRSLIDDGKRTMRRRYRAVEDEVLRHPAKAILYAVAAGYLLHRLPVRSLLVAKVRLIAALTPPVLLAYGAAKTCEYLQQKARQG